MSFAVLAGIVAACLDAIENASSSAYLKHTAAMLAQSWSSPSRRKGLGKLAIELESSGISLADQTPRPKPEIRITAQGLSGLADNFDPLQMPSFHAPLVWRCGRVRASPPRRGIDGISCCP